MLIEDAIASLQVHEVPERAEKMRLYHKVNRAYWGISNSAIDDLARIWRQELNLDERLKLAADLWNTNIIHTASYRGVYKKDNYHEAHICVGKVDPLDARGVDVVIRASAKNIKVTSPIQLHNLEDDGGYANNFQFTTEPKTGMIAYAQRETEEPEEARMLFYTGSK